MNQALGKTAYFLEIIIIIIIIIIISHFTLGMNSVATPRSVIPEDANEQL